MLSNGFVEVTVDLTGGAWISTLRGDFQGGSNYGNNLLSDGGFKLERLSTDNQVFTAAGKGSPSPSATSNSNGCSTLSIDSIVDDIDFPTVTDSWVITLCDSDRGFTFSSKGSVLPTVPAGTSVRAVRHSLYLTPISIFSFFERGVVQMMDASPERSYFGSQNAQQRVYALGETGCVDILRPGTTGGASDSTVLLSATAAGSALAGDIPRGTRSGLQQILVGSYGASDSSEVDRWTPGWVQLSDSTVLADQSWSKTLFISPNNYNFPAAKLPPGNNLDGNGAGELGAFVTGIYANGVGNLCTFDNEVALGEHVAQIATSLRTDNCTFSLVVHCRTLKWKRILYLLLYQIALCVDPLFSRINSLNISYS